MTCPMYLVIVQSEWTPLVPGTWYQVPVFACAAFALLIPLRGIAYIAYIPESLHMRLRYLEFA